MLDTPFGTVEMFMDGRQVQPDIIRVPGEPHWPDVDGAFHLRYAYHADGASHELTCLFSGNFQEGDVESGERLEMRSLHCGEGKLSIGVEGEFGLEGFCEYGFDFNGEYLPNGLKIKIMPDTKSREFVFGVAWLKRCTEDNDVQTWYMADPALYKSF